MDLLKNIVSELLEWENKNDVLQFKFEYENTLLWPLIRSTVFSRIIENKGNLQTPHAPPPTLKLSEKINFLYQTIKGNPFGLERTFDILVFSSVAGVSLKVDNKWLGRISDYFVLEHNDQSLILETSHRKKYKLPRVPAHVCCRDYIRLKAFLACQIFVPLKGKDLEEIRRLMSFLKDSWKDQLKAEDYLFIERILRLFSLRISYLHKAYLKLFREVKPKILFIEGGSYGGIDAWIIKWAKECGILTGEFQHGCIDIPYMYSDRLFFNEEYKKYLPDYLLMYGQYWHDLVRSPSKQIIIGNPHLDTKKKEFAGVKKMEVEKTILIVSQGTVTKILVKLALELAQICEEEDYKIIFRLHPGEEVFVERYASLKDVKNIQIDKDQDIYKLISDADYIVGTSSLTLFEAIALDKKVYVLENEDSKAYVPLDVGLRFNNAKELFELINNDSYQPVKDAKIYWADHWRENYHSFINSIVGQERS